MTDFIWPSDIARAENDELNRVCEHLEEVLDERDALAALCQEGAAVLERTANDTLDGRNMAVRLREANTTSLARLKAQWAQEGARAAAQAIRMDYEGAIHADDIADFVDEIADDYRRQAEDIFE